MEEVEIQVAEIALTPEQMEEIERLAAEAQEKKRQILSKLAQDVESEFAGVATRRTVKEKEWIESTRLKLGSLSGGRGPDKSQPLTNDGGSSKPYHNLVRTKCNVAVAQGIISQFAGGDKNWDISPTPVPSVDPQEALVKAENMENLILDQQTEDNYGYKCRLAMEDRVSLGTGILKGPLPAREARLTYEITTDEEGKIVTIPQYTTFDRPTVSHVSPWFFFPDDSVNDIRRATFASELHPMSKLEVAKLAKNPGFFKDAIAELLKLDPENYTNEAFSEYAQLTESGTNFLKGKYPVIERHGPISIDELGALGIEPSYDPLGEMYFGEVWVCQGIVIRAELEAVSGLYQLPYFVCPWTRDPNSIFGFSLPLEIKDPQRIAEVTLDMILENASNSSGPIPVFNTQYIEPLDGNWEFRPWKPFGTTDYTLQDVSQAVKFIDVPNHIGDLMPILSFAREVAQEESGVPLLAAGLQSPQVQSDSATGLAIQQQNQTIVSDFKNEEWDDNVTEGMIRRWVHINMQFNPSPDIVGDYEVDVRSSTEYRNKQLFVRDIEKLSVEAAQNPALAAVINMDALTRTRLSMMHLPNKAIVKTPEQVREEQEAAANNPPPPDPALLKIEVEKERLAFEREKLQLEQQKMQFELNQQQQREMWDHDERMEAIKVRGIEAQARVIEANAEREMELLKLAQRDEESRTKIMADLEKSQITEQNQRFALGIEAQKAAESNALKAAELELAKKTGSGI